MLIVAYEFWNEIKDLIPEKKSKVGRPEFDKKRSFDGIFFVLRTGCQWKNLPDYYGKPTTIHGKFMRWSRAKVFDQIQRKAIKFYQDKVGRHGIWYAIDSISVKTPLGGQKTGNNPTDRRKKGSKRTMIVDQRGAPLAITAGAANTHDSQFLKETFNLLKSTVSLNETTIIAADSAYDSKELRAFLRSQNCILLAAENKRRKKVMHKLYKPRHRWIVERTHSWISNNRGLKIRWAKHEESFLGFCAFASSIQLFKMSGIFV